MTSNLKVLALALVAVFAMSAITASAASAQQGKLTSDGPVTLTVTEIGATGSGNNVLTAFGGKLEAFGTTYTGHKYNVTPHTFIPSGETTFTVTPHYNQPECRSVLLGVTRTCTIVNTGCDFVFHIGVTTELPNTYGVTADLVCPVGGSIHVETTKTGTTHEAPNLFCSTTVTPQTGLAGPHLTSDPVNDDVVIKGTFNNIHVEKSGACLASTENAAKFDINATIKGHNSLGANTGVTITH